MAYPLSIFPTGRGSNQWTSPPGCLMFSLSLTHTDGRSLPLLQYVAALAVVKALEGCCGARKVWREGFMSRSSAGEWCEEERRMEKMQ